MNRGLFGVLVGLVAAGAALWVARRFLGGGEEEAPYDAGLVGGPPSSDTAGAGEVSGGAAPRREGLDPTLLEILACPDDKSPVIYQREGDAERLTCTKCGKRYPVRDGIPVMLVDEATPGPVPTEAEVAAARALIPQGQPAIVPLAPSGTPEAPSS